MKLEELSTEHVKLIEKAAWLEGLLDGYDAEDFREALKNAGWRIDALRSVMQMGILAAAKVVIVGDTHELTLEQIEERLPEKNYDKHDDLTYEQWEYEVENGISAPIFCISEE